MAKSDGDLLPGTFDLLLLKALSLGPMHGWGLAERIERLSVGACQVPQGTVYPALQRLRLRGWVRAEWRITEHQRRARFYTLTPAGRRQLAIETEWWQRSSRGVDRVLRATPQEG